MTTLNRRTLLKVGAAAGAAALGGAAKALEIPDADKHHWDRTCDVLVIGFGGAGGPAAVSAKEAVADVLVIEKMSVGGGNCTVSSGGFVCVDNVEDGMAYMKKTYELSKGECDEELLRIFCEGSVSIKDWIAALDPEAKFRVYGHAGW